MSRSALYDKEYSPQFSGHETFPIRYGWLKKVVDTIEEKEGFSNNSLAVRSEEAIGRFGVGKNMVSAMRFWAKATGVITEPKSSISDVQPIGRLLFSDGGLDPYMENPATLWLLHWLLASNPERTTWYWAFNHFPAVQFEREGIIGGLARFAKEKSWPKSSVTTIAKDVACFLRTYVAKEGSGQLHHDDLLESPLTELGLIRPIGKRDGFRFVRGPKPSLGLGVLAYAVVDFWSRAAKDASTMSFEAVAYAPGGPGRVFLLSDDDIAIRLAAIERATEGAFRWSETAGLRQLIRTKPIEKEAALEWVRRDYLEQRYAD